MTLAGVHQISLFMVHLHKKMTGRNMRASILCMGVLIIIVVLIGIGYLVSLRRHPWRACRACKGTGRQFGAVWKGSHRLCTSCGGNGRRARRGIDVFHGGGEVWGERSPKDATTRRSRNFGR